MGRGKNVANYTAVTPGADTMDWSWCMSSQSAKTIDMSPPPLCCSWRFAECTAVSANAGGLVREQHMIFVFANSRQFLRLSYESRGVRRVVRMAVTHRMPAAVVFAPWTIRTWRKWSENSTNLRHCSSSMVCTNSVDRIARWRWGRLRFIPFAVIF